MKNIFEGLRVLDLSTVLAGPSVATFFAELGAEVVKIENPSNGGDVTRSWKLKSEEQNSSVSAYFSSVNYHKKYLWLNIAEQDNRQTLEALIAESDIVIINFKTGDDVKFKLTPAIVCAINPKIVYAKITGFDSNPERVAYDVVLQAETGYMHMNGTAESGPIKMPVAIMDVLAAHQLKEGILCALLNREKTGQGCVVECSLEKAGLSALVNQATNFLMANHIPQRAGSLHPNISPYGETFTCLDGKQIVLAVGSDKQFREMCSLLGDSHLSEENEFATNQQRVINRAMLASRLSPLFAQKAVGEWINIFVEHHIPAGAIKSMDEVMQNNIAKEMILDEIIDGRITRRMASAAFTIKPY
jgi:crotonobetainyl-CoA:carnitine CoA-transferase CaiB-like acyl-CoA transferase